MIILIHLGTQVKTANTVVADNSVYFFCGCVGNRCLLFHPRGLKMYRNYGEQFNDIPDRV